MTRRSNAPWHALLAFGLALAVHGLVVRECPADGIGIFHPHRTYYSKTVVKGPMAGYPVHSTTGMPMTGSPMTAAAAGTPSSASGGQPTFAPPPTLPGAGGAPVAPLAPLSPFSRSGVQRPRSPFQHLFGFNPDDPATPAHSSAEGIQSHQLGNRLFQGIRNLGSALITDQGQGSPLQLGINLFGDLTGVSPVAEDVDKIFKMVNKAAQEHRATNTPAPAREMGTTEVPADATSGVTTIQITITVQGPARVKVSPPTTNRDTAPAMETTPVPAPAATPGIPTPSTPPGSS